MANGQGKDRDILFFFKAREFCEMVRKILNSMKVGEMSGNFLILAQNCLAVAGISSILSD